MKYALFCALLLSFNISVLFAAEVPAIHQAIREGDFPKVKEILKNDPSQINTPDPTKNDKVPLLVAVVSGYKNIVSFLIDQGADVNMMHKGKGISPLGMSAILGNRSMAALLLEKGANVNGPKKVPTAMTPLMLAIESGNYSLVKHLVENGANVNLKSQDGTKSFTWSDFITHLAENGVDFNVELEKGTTPLSVAKENKGRIVNYLIEKGAK